MDRRKLYQAVTIYEDVFEEDMQQILLLLLYCKAIEPPKHYQGFFGFTQNVILANPLQIENVYYSIAVKYR